MVLKLWFLLVDGKRFHGMSIGHRFVRFYRERMKSLARMSVELPEIYKSFREFIDNNVFGEEEEEVVHPSMEKQGVFLQKFNAKFEEEKARRKERQDKKERADSRSAIDEAPGHPASGSVFTVAPNPRSTEPPHPQIIAGCVWDRNNWSCAYDTAFMCFWSIYKKSPPSWRNNWSLHAPKWYKFFGAAFQSLLTMAQDERTSQVALCNEFSAYRETFRTKLNIHDPTYFKRGKVSISVSQILGHVFSDSGESQPHLNQVVVCDTCHQSTLSRCCFTLLGTMELLCKYLTEDDTGPRLPLQDGVTRFIQNALREPHCSRCPNCSKLVKVQSLSMPEMPWLWIEFFGTVSPISPSPRLVFNLQDQHQTYTLEAIIYGGENHFTARLSDESDLWWTYDGMWKPDVLRTDRIEHEADLLDNGDRHAVCLLYRRTDFQG